MDSIKLGSLLLALSMTFAGCGEVEVTHTLALPTLAPAEIGAVKNAHALGNFWTSDQPSAADLEVAKQKGIRTVINLRHAAEQQDFDERAVVEKLGLRYTNLPWMKPEELTDEVFAEARRLLNTAERPILIHCSSANRVGAVWLPWRVLDGGLSVEDALAEAKTVGLKKPEFEQRALDYIKRTK